MFAPWWCETLLFHGAEKMRAQSQIQAKQKTRAAHRRAAASPHCALCAKRTQWKPAVRKSLDEAAHLADDLDSGKLTREKMINDGELLTVETFIQRLHERSGYVSC